MEHRRLGRLEELSKEATAGSQTAALTLREELRANPVAWDLVGDLARDVERTLARLAAGEDPVRLEAIRDKLARMRRELVGEDPQPLERLLGDRIALLWLEVHHADLIYLRRFTEGLTPGQAAHYLRWKDRAQRRYLAAIRSLAQVRRLLLPLVQVNVAEQQQVNVLQTLALSGRRRRKGRKAREGAQAES